MTGEEAVLKRGASQNILHICDSEGFSHPPPRSQHPSTNMPPLSLTEDIRDNLIFPIGSAIIKPTVMSLSIMDFVRKLEFGSTWEVVIAQCIQQGKLQHEWG
jgi:hypothetical protein